MRYLSLLLWVGWNLVLAGIPVVLGYAIRGVAGAARERRGVWLPALLFGIGVVWFVFLPNTCYLLTEWRHFLAELDGTDLYLRWSAYRQPMDFVNLMGQTFFYLGYSATGMLAFALATRPVAGVLRRGPVPLWVWGIPFFILMSLGVYLGLVLRFNSWELLNRPGEIWLAVLDAFSRARLAALILAFAGFLWVSYLVLDIWIDGFLLRWRAWQARPDAC